MYFVISHQSKGLHRCVICSQFGVSYFIVNRRAWESKYNSKLWHPMTYISTVNWIFVLILYPAHQSQQVTSRSLFQANCTTPLASSTLWDRHSECTLFFYCTLPQHIIRLPAQRFFNHAWWIDTIVFWQFCAYCTCRAVGTALEIWLELNWVYQ